MVQRAYRTKYVCKQAPTGNTIKRIVDNFKKTGQTFIINIYTREKRIKTKELEESIKNLVLDDPKISTRKIARKV